MIILARGFALAGISLWRSRVFALVLPLGTWLLPYGIVVNNHGVAALLMAVVTVLLMVISTQGATAMRVACLSGALGLLVAIELLPVVFVPFIAAFLIARRDVGTAALAVAAGALSAPLIAQAALNVQITGDVIPAGLHHAPATGCNVTLRSRPNVTSL